MKNECFDWPDLKLIAPFSLYRLEEDQLLKIADIGTTGRSPLEVNLNDGKYQHYAMVQVAKSQKGIMRAEAIEGRQVISYKMDVDNEIWIYNLHIDVKTNEKALLLSGGSDIINSNEIFRLIHSLCLLANAGIKKGVGEDAKHSKGS